MSVKEAAALLEMHVSSLYRELRRNLTAADYISGKAQDKAAQRRLEAKICSKRDNPVLIATIEKMIGEKLSPEQVSGRLRLENPLDTSKQVSTETIYLHMYSKIKAGDNSIGKNLRHNHIKRRKRLTSKDKRGIIVDRTLIDKRPPIVETKSRIGDWEGDTIEGARKQGYIMTMVDRHSKYLMASLMRHKTADLLEKNASKAFRDIPMAFRKTLTVDNGKEFAFHKKIARKTGLEVYFARPYHSWERGLNEHTNGLLRQYFPKGTSFYQITAKELAAAVESINNRPRKALGYRTPNEVFFAQKFALQI
jgi:IS30 family transposase